MALAFDAMTDLTHLLPFLCNVDEPPKEAEAGRKRVWFGAGPVVLPGKLGAREEMARGKGAHKAIGVGTNCQPCYLCTIGAR